MIAVRGEVDLATAGDLLLRLRMLTDPVSEPILPDLSQITFIDCSGLRAFERHVATAGGSVHVAAVIPRGRPAVRAGRIMPGRGVGPGPTRARNRARSRRDPLKIRYVGDRRGLTSQGTPKLVPAVCDALRAGAEPDRAQRSRGPKRKSASASEWGASASSQTAASRLTLRGASSGGCERCYELPRPGGMLLWPNCHLRWRLLLRCTSCVRSSSDEPRLGVRIFRFTYAAVDSGSPSWRLSATDRPRGRVFKEGLLRVRPAARELESPTVRPRCPVRRAADG